MPTPRRRLPNRRPSETRILTVGNHTFTATIGFDPEDGRPREVFLDGAKSGGELAAILGDAAVIISIALQHGISAATLAKTISREPVAPLTPADLAKAAGSRLTAPASVIGTTLDLLAQFETEPARSHDNASCHATKIAPERP